MAASMQGVPQTPLARPRTAGTRIERRTHAACSHPVKLARSHTGRPLRQQGGHRATQGGHCAVQGGRYQQARLVRLDALHERLLDVDRPADAVLRCAERQLHLCTAGRQPASLNTDMLVWLYLVFYQPA